MKHLLRRLRYALRLFWLGWQIAGGIHKIAVNKKWLADQERDLSALADLEYEVQVTAGEKIIERELGR